MEGELDRNGHIVRHDKNPVNKIAEIYKGHEVATHTLTHPNLTYVKDDSAVEWQVEQDRKTLSSIVGYDVQCMAYPCGGINCDDRVEKIIRNKTGIRFARTVNSSYSFDVPENLLKYDPTVYYIEKDKLFELGEKFINLKPDKPQVFYIWGHSYEMDAEYISWEEFKKFCKMISGLNDVCVYVQHSWYRRFRIKIQNTTRKISSALARRQTRGKVYKKKCREIQSRQRQSANRRLFRRRAPCRTALYLP